MRFADPYLLFALLAVPLAALGYRVLEVRRAERSAAWSRRALLPNMVRRPRLKLTAAPVALFLLGLTLLLVGFARPQRVRNTASGGAPTVVVAIDISGSMAATDVKPTRLRAVRRTAIQFLQRLPSTYRVAIVTFGNNPHLLVAPTFDRQQAIAALPTRVSPLAGTGIGDAIGESVATVVQAVGKSVPHRSARYGAVLLLSDGTQTAGGASPTQAALTALADGVAIDTVLVGTANGSVTQSTNVDGDQSTTQIPVPVDTQTLRLVSQRTGGAAVTEGASADRLVSLYAHLRPHVTRTESNHDLSAAAGGVALVFIFAGIALSSFWFGRAA